MSQPDPSSTATLREIVLSRIWHEGRHASELRTVDGRRVGVIYRGVWTHSNGPDFRDAMLEIDGRLVSGAVEVHLRSSDWSRHGHNDDPAYDSVVLHVVLHDDASGTGALHGRRIPTIELGAFLVKPLEELLTELDAVDLGALGSSTCLPTLAGGRVDLVRDALRRKGWERLATKRLRYTQELQAASPGEVLYRGLLDGLGLVANRVGMAAITDVAPLTVLEATVLAYDLSGALALLLGCGGFLPLTEAGAEYAELEPRQAEMLERHWEQFRSAWALNPVSPALWSLNRVRPANHPVRRLASLAHLAATAGAGGLLGRFLACLDNAPEAWTTWLATASPAIGAGRIRQIATNVLAPFLGAYADATGDFELAEQSNLIWERLPGKIEDAIARSTLRQIADDARVPIRTALEEQGLHQIGRFGCAQLRCFECPIAALAARYESLGPLQNSTASRSG